MECGNSCVWYQVMCRMMLAVTVCPLAAGPVVLLCRVYQCAAPALNRQTELAPDTFFLPLKFWPPWTKTQVSVTAVML